MQIDTFARLWQRTCEAGGAGPQPQSGPAPQSTRTQAEALKR